MNNYKEVKNLVHNDLGITKDDIKKIIEQTVEKEIKKFFNDESRLNSFMLTYIKDLLKGDYENPNYRKVFMINNLIYDNVCSEISKIVKENLKIHVGVNKENLELYEIKKSNPFEECSKEKGK